MTNQEFSDEFDVLYNSITSNQAPGLDEYEKSVFLTKAQDEILKSYFDPKKNKVQEGFDGNQRRQIDFSDSISVEKFTGVSLAPPVFDTRNNVKSIVLRDDTLMVLNERLIVTRGAKVTLTVVPIQFWEYDRLSSKPFKRPLKNQAWRVIMGTSGKSDLIPGPSDYIDSYIVRYVKRPTPIILGKLEGVTIGGYYGADDLGLPTEDSSQATQGIECKLDPILHPEILQRAVELAKATYAGDLQSQIALGQASHTDIGMVTQSR